MINEKGETKTIAERLHDSYIVQIQVEEIISDAFDKYEPEIYEKLDFSIGSDYYDNSIEVYIKNVIPYPYEPCWEIRDIIYALGFGTVYWNFADESGEFVEEIRAEEPRRLKSAPERSDAKWCKDFFDKWGINGTDKRFDGTWLNKYQRKRA